MTFFVIIPRGWRILKPNYSNHLRNTSWFLFSHWYPDNLIMLRVLKFLISSVNRKHQLPRNNQNEAEELLAQIYFAAWHVRRTQKPNSLPKQKCSPGKTRNTQEAESLVVGSPSSTMRKRNEFPKERNSSKRRSPAGCISWLSQGALCCLQSGVQVRDSEMPVKIALDQEV